jgi:transcription initiation factor TFIID TATA-box-binding protein
VPNITTSDLKVVNIVGSGDLDVEIDLTVLIEDLTAFSLTYTPDQFPGLQIEFESSMPMCSLFSSGKYTIVGAKSQDKLYTAQERLIKELTELDILATNFFDEDFDVRNIVCTYDIGTELDLSRVSVKLGLENVEYEPEQSPFIVYKPEGQGATITIPANGRVMITGVANKEDALTAVHHFLDELDVNDE